jgi:hypothetical protein
VEKHPPRLSFSAFFHLSVSARGHRARLHDVPSALAALFSRFFGASVRRAPLDLKRNKFFFKKKAKKHLHFLHGSVKIDKLIILIPYFTARRCK